MCSVTLSKAWSTCIYGRKYIVISKLEIFFWILRGMPNWRTLEWLANWLTQWPNETQVLHLRKVKFLSRKYCLANSVKKISSNKYCPANIFPQMLSRSPVPQIMSKKYCPANIVPKKSYPANIVPQFLVQEFCCPAIPCLGKSCPTKSFPAFPSNFPSSLIYVVGTFVRY